MFRFSLRERVKCIAKCSNLQGGKVHLEELGENVGDLGKSLDLGVAAEVGHVFDRLQIIVQSKQKSSKIKMMQPAS